MSIHILPVQVASQIAAGEVVERPASVVKELLENSLDASANFINIEIQDAGRQLIEISDNGSGIASSELALAIERHATSKLVDAQDLFNIKTLGFRGEALASIGSVSRMSITSRTADSQVGARCQVDAGHFLHIEPVGAPVGTLVRVENLFYNVPARLKFLKHPNTERRHIDHLVSLYALAYPKVRFHLKQEARIAFQTSGNGDRREVLVELYGAEIARQLLEVIAEEPGLQVHGFISSPALTRSNRREIHFFVNGRPIQDSSLSAALIKAYHTLLMVGRYPQAILFIELSPESVDVNVHPAKAEIRFRESERVFSGVQRAVRRALLAHSPVPGFGDTLRWSAQYSPQHAEYVSPQSSDFGHDIPKSWEHDQFPANDEIPSLSHEPYRPSTIIPEGGVSLLRLIGQIANTYLIAEGPDGLYLIDQHAAHERILFEKLSIFDEQTNPSQAFLQPIMLELSSANARIIEEQLPLLAKIGFQIEAFGPNTFLIRAIPALLKDVDPHVAILALVEDFEEDETPLKSFNEERLIARICKRSAIKGGQALSAQEQQALLTDLEACQSPRTCPHGRPTMIHLSVDLLERQFGRRGAR